MDIVERLRKMVGVYIGDADIDDDLNNAADEIERLRVKLNEATKLAEDSILAAESFHKRNIQASKLIAEALDEIERMQEILLKIKQESNDDHIRAWAHQALQQKDSE